MHYHVAHYYQDTPNLPSQLRAGNLAVRDYDTLTEALHDQERWHARIVSEANKYQMLTEEWRDGAYRYVKTRNEAIITLEAYGCDDAHDEQQVG